MAHNAKGEKPLKKTHQFRQLLPSLCVVIVNILGELHISDLSYLLSYHFFLLYAYLQKDNILGDGISPTFYGTSDITVQKRQ